MCASFPLSGARMQDVATAAQTQQWAFILSQLFDWVMAGLAWIVPFQAKVFGTLLQGDSFWTLAGVSVLLVLPAGAFVAGIWGTMGSLYTISFRLRGPGAPPPIG